MPLFLARHGHTELNSATADDDRLRGWLDVPLDVRGRLDAERLARDFGPHLKRDARVITSDLVRARDVAYELAREARTERPERREELRPWDIGKLAGKQLSRVFKQLEQLMRQPDVRAPSGESYRHFLHRWLGFLAEMYPRYSGNERPQCVMVTHTRNIQACRGWVAAGMPSSLEIDLNVALDYEGEAAPGTVLELRTGGALRAPGRKAGA